LLDYLAGAEIIIHNAPFDVGFLNKELELLGRGRRSRAHVGSVTDTLVMAKELFPGKRNSLDALCDRLGVDNSGRTLHGALLDAELLADVYINMTRGQEALLMDRRRQPTDRSDGAQRRFQQPSSAGVARQRAGARGPCRRAARSSTRPVAARPSGRRPGSEPVA
jgi:DNA polymerase-3 subunit epsilon